MATIFYRRGEGRNVWTIQYYWNKKRYRKTVGKDEKVALKILKKIQERIDEAKKKKLFKQMGMGNFFCPTCGQFIDDIRR